MRAFLAVPNHRLGECTLTGPVTKKIYHVTRQGTYIDEADVGLLELKKEVYCWRSESLITINVIAGSPSLIKEI